MWGVRHTITVCQEKTRPGYIRQMKYRSALIVSETVGAGTNAKHSRFVKTKMESMDGNIRML